jgi:exosortase/archaeosortase family protein
MDRSSQKALGRTVLALVLIFGLLQAVRTPELLSGLTKPAVISVLTWMGADAVDHGNRLVVESISVPWSRDCSGFDVLLVLWVLVLWTARSEPLARAFWIRFLMTIPVSLLVNGVRVLAIVAWRYFLHPAVESPSMHYFIGVLCLLPLLPFFVPAGSLKSAQGRIELVLFGAALCLIAGQIGGPGGFWVTASALILLSDQRWCTVGKPIERAWVCLWSAAAAGIALTGMESLWLPWLLVCPWTASRRFLFSPAILLVFGTVPLFAMKFPFLIAVGMGWVLWVWSRTLLSSSCRPGLLEAPVPVDRSVRSLSIGTSVFLFGMILLPFVASSAGAFLASQEEPPSGMMATRLEPGSYRLRLIGQSPDIALTWHAANGSGRHHTLPVCMRYRGVTLDAIKGTRTVYTDGSSLMREGFLMPDGSVVDDSTYLQRTFLPFSDPGIHLVASAPCDVMSAVEFQERTSSLFSRVGMLSGSSTHAPESLALQRSN